MANYQLKQNDEKNEFLIIGSRKQLFKVNMSAIHVGASEIKLVGSVRNLGAWFDSSMTMRTHVGIVCSQAFLTYTESGNTYPRNPPRSWSILSLRLAYTFATVLCCMESHSIRRSG